MRYLAVPARPYSGNGLGRILNIWDFSRNLVGVGRVQARKAVPDVIVASSPHPFTIFPAFRLARRFRAKLVFEIRDIWPLSITEILGVSRLHPFVQACAFAERFALSKSDLIASVLPRLDRYLADRGFGHKPFVWVPNGTGPQRDNAAFSSEEGKKAAALATKWEAEGDIVIVHAGAMGKPNAVDLLVEALAYGRSIGEARNCRLLLIGGGQEEAALRELAESKGVTDIHFSGRVPKSDVPLILENCGIAYGGVRTHDNLYRYGVSLNKFADYYRASLPVLLPITPCGDPVSESGGGIARRLDTPEEIWRTLRELVVLTPQQRRTVGEKGNKYMADKYDYAGIASRYVEAFQQSPGSSPSL